MYPHRIRLRGPWECEPLARTVCRPGGETATETERLPAPLRMTIPCRWNEGGLADFVGRVRFRRNFGYPGRVDSHEHLWLTFGGVDTFAEVTVNGQCLGRHQGADAPFEFEITPLLQNRNTLQVDVESATGSGGICGEVALEVRCSAFLRGVRVWSEGEGHTADLHAAGEVVGASESPLEVYLMLNARALARQRIEAVPTGQPFHLVAPRVPVRRSTDQTADTSPIYKTRVDLVCGTMIWYVVEDLVTFPESGRGS